MTTYQQEPVHESPHVNRWLVTVGIIFGTLMGAVNSSIINVALPNIRATLGVSLTEVSWVATGYLVALIVILPLTPWLSSVIGRKRLYLISVVLFTVASLGCGLVGRLDLLVVFRILQGLGAGMMQPIAQAVLRESFPPEEQAMAMGIFGIAVLLGPAIGPTLGGWVTDNYGWPWIFFINPPIGMLAFVLASRFLYDPPYLSRQKVSDVDYLGIALLAIGLASLQTVLSEGQNDDWFESSFIVTLGVIACTTLIVFIIWELRTPKPAVDLSILANSGFASGTLLGGMLGLALYGSMFLLPLFMQELLKYNATQSGIAMLPRCLVMVVGMPIAGRLYNRTGPRPMVGAGLALSALAAFQMSRFTTNTSIIGLTVPQAWQGLAFSLIFVSLSTAALASVPRPRMTNATALYNLVRQMGGSFGIAILATILEKHQDVAGAQLSSHVNTYNPAFLLRYDAMAQALASRGVVRDEAGRKTLALINGLVNQQAAVLSFEYAFAIVGILFVCTLPLVLLLRSRKG